MVSHPRIVSLLPGATEMIGALGALSQLVGVSHECDEPVAVRSLPRVTTTPIDVEAPSAAIHEAVQRVMADGRQAIAIDAELLRTLRPDLLVTQALCDVCAVADGEAVRLAQVMDPPPRVVTLQGRTLDEVWDDMVVLGEAIGHAETGRELAARCRAEVATLAAEHTREDSPRVVAVEWLEPLFLAGHWVPEMIAAAGGIDAGAVPGAHSTIREWDEIKALEPDLVLVILCGFDEARARAELAAMPDGPARAWLATQQVAVLDGNAFTSRPGPRLLEGIRQMAAAIGMVHGGRERGAA
jgi:iron complex transport system substrate-binding protein